MGLYVQMSNIKTINDCKNCSFFNRCAASVFDEESFHRFGKMVDIDKEYATNMDLFQQGGSARYLYVIKSGGFKTHSSLSIGSAHIHGFYLPGELLGLESVPRGVSLTTATATEKSLVCRINYMQLVTLRKDFPALSDLALSIYGQALAWSQIMLECISRPSAASRVACFVLIMFERSGSLRSKSNDLYLTMSRNDMANHLGLAGETVSRAFAKLVSLGYITKNRRHVHILDMEGLQLCSSNTAF